MKEFFPREEFRRLGLSEPAIRLLERLADIKEIGTRVSLHDDAINKVATQVMDLPSAALVAEAATAAATARMDDILPVTITADYTGTIDTGQLPRNVAAHRYAGNEDVTVLTGWSASTDSGTITYTIGASTGVLNITALGSSSVVTITSLHNGVTLSKKVTITKQVASAPSTGSAGGTSAYDTSFASFNAATMATVSDVLTVTVGSAGEVQLSAPLSVFTDASGAAASYPVYGIWQHDTTGGGAWADLGTETLNAADCFVEIEEPGGPGAERSVTEGSLGVSYLKTGLTPATSQKFRLQARNSSGTRPMYLSGTASAVGS